MSVDEKPKMRLPWRRLAGHAHNVGGLRTVIGETAIESSAHGIGDAATAKDSHRTRQDFCWIAGAMNLVLDQDCQQKGQSARRRSDGKLACLQVVGTLMFC